jgi:hypothetical protein
MNRPSTRPPEERVADVAGMLQAMDLAVREALALHKRAGNAVPVWREGRVVWIPPEDIPVDDLAEHQPD